MMMIHIHYRKNKNLGRNKTDGKESKSKKMNNNLYPKPSKYKIMNSSNKNTKNSQTDAAVQQSQDWTSMNNVVILKNLKISTKTIKRKNSNTSITTKMNRKKKIIITVEA